MSNLSFRPRALDVTRPIPIIRKELEDEIDIGSMGRTMPEMPTGMEDHEEREKHIQDLLNKAIYTNSQVEIPTPVVKVVEGYDTEEIAPFIRPQYYIRVNEKTPEEFDQLVDYDLEDEDVKFLDTVPVKGLTESKLEVLLDRFEKEANKVDNVPPLKQMEQTVDTEELKTPALQQVYEYWKTRRNRLGHPLNMRYLKPPEPEDPSPYKAFRPRTDDMKKIRKSRKNDQPSLQKLRQMRQEMERARTILEQIKKREKLKMDKVTYMRRIFELQMELVQNEPDKVAQFITPDEEELFDEPLPHMFEDEMDFFPPPASLPPKKKKRETYTAPVPRPPKKRKAVENDGFTVRSVPKKEEPKEIYDIVFSDDEMSEFSEDEKDFEQKEAAANYLTDIADINEEENMIPQTVGTINLPNMPPFRGRVRMDRLGHIVFDKLPAPKTNGIVHHLETDADCYPRLQSFISMYKEPYNPISAAATDAEKLLRKLETMIQKKKKQDAKSQSATPMDRDSVVM